MENPTAGHSAENILMEHPDDHLQMQTPMVNEQQENDITSDESPSRCQDIVKAKCRDMKELRDALRALSEKGKRSFP